MKIDKAVLIEKCEQIILVLDAKITEAQAEYDNFNWRAEAGDLYRDLGRAIREDDKEATAEIAYAIYKLDAESERAGKRKITDRQHFKDSIAQMLVMLRASSEPALNFTMEAKTNHGSESYWINQILQFDLTDAAE